MMKTWADKAPAQDLRTIAANAARDLALGIRLTGLRMASFEPGQGKEIARELAEQLSAAARRAVELYYLESLTQAVAAGEGPLKVRRRDELEMLIGEHELDIQNLKSDVSGCYNQLGFEMLLETELERARRKEAQLSIGLFRLDPPDADTIADVAGHARECCRLLDVCGLFDEMELAVFLPDTGSEGAQVAAQRVLGSFLSTRDSNGDAFDAARLAVGVSTYPQDGDQPGVLLETARERA